MRSPYQFYSSSRCSTRLKGGISCALARQRCQTLLLGRFRCPWQHLELELPSQPRSQLCSVSLLRGMATSIFLSLLAFSNVSKLLQHMLSLTNDAGNEGPLILLQRCHGARSRFPIPVQHLKHLSLVKLGVIMCDQGFLCILGYSMCFGCSSVYCRCSDSHAWFS